METTWKKRTALGVMTVGLLLGGVYTGTDFSQSNIAEEVSAASATKLASTQFKTTDNLNLRAGASIKHKVLVTIPEGTKVSSATKVGNWYKVTYKGKTGYVSGTYLTKATDAKTPAVSTATYYQTTDNLNLRTGASVKYKVLVNIPKGGKVTYLSKSGSWYKVKYGNKTGFVNSKYLKKATDSKPAPKPNVTKPKPPATSTQYQTTDNLNLRTGASVKNKIVTTIPEGGKVTYVSKKGSWYKVKYGNKTGYVSSKYLKKVSGKTPAPKPTPKPTPAPNVGNGKTFQTTDSLNLRKGASVKNKIVTTIPKGGKVTYMSADGSWYKVKYNNKTGYVNSKYLKAVTVKETPKTEKPKAPAIKQNLMNRTQAEAHVATHLDKYQNGGYRMVSPTGRQSIMVGLESATTGKAHLAVDIINYASATEIQPGDFGQDAYDSSKAYLTKMNGAIVAYAETQFGIGNADAKKLVGEVQSLAIKGKRGDVKKLTLQGKSVTVKYDGTWVTVKY